MFVNLINVCVSKNIEKYSILISQTTFSDCFNMCYLESRGGTQVPTFIVYNINLNGSKNEIFCKACRANKLKVQVMNNLPEKRHTILHFLISHKRKLGLQFKGSPLFVLCYQRHCSIHLRS